MRLISRLLLCLALSSAGIVYADGNEYQLELDSLFLNKRYDTLYERLMFPQSREETRVSLLWMKTHFKSGDGGARMAYIYAARLNGSGITDTALFVYTVAAMTARMDAARCEDLDAPISKIVKWEKGLQHMQKAFRDLPLPRQERFLNLAAQFEQKTRHRGIDEWMCAGGKSQYEAYFRKYGADANPPLKITSVPFSKEKILILDDASIKPQVIDEQRWNALTDQVTKKVRAELMTGKENG